MKTHDYHFLITEDLKIDLNQIEKLNNFSFSGKINYIMNKTDRIIKYLGILKINENSKVEYLKTKKDIHVYIKEKLFKHIKYYHGKFNFYSIAVLVRIILKVFINMVKQYGFERALKKLKKKTKKISAIGNLKSKKYQVIQLLIFLRIKNRKNLKFDTILTRLLL